MVPTSVVEKERLIQSGALHYSELLAPESPPTPAYLAIYEDALRSNAITMARAVVSLAKGLALQIDGPITLVSLARAGVPIGVLLQRALRQLGRQSHHYGVSIIRDRGLDAVAMSHILNRHAAASIIFVDGWTGKGAIARELAAAGPRCGIAAPRLATLGDIGGFAWMAPTQSDWLIPSGILGGVVSGLVSRTILNDEIRQSGGFHGCKLLPHLAPHDVSRPFVQAITEQFDLTAPASRPTSKAARKIRQSAVNGCIDLFAEWHGITNKNRIKPSLAEATRAVLRRRPHMVYVASDNAPDTAALMHLIKDGNLRHEVAPEMTGPYRAVTIIEKTS